MMVKKILLMTILSLFLFVDFSCVVITPRTDPPPRQRKQVKTRRPGKNYIWVKGHWIRKKKNWVWKTGYWIKIQKGKRWVPGRWTVRKGRKVWRKGHWVKK